MKCELNFVLPSKKECHYYGIMARNQNPISTVQITLSTTERLKTHLAALVETGLFGKNVAEAAERLVARGVTEELKNGTIPRGQAVKGQS